MQKIQMSSMYGEKQLSLNEYQLLAGITMNLSLDQKTALTNYALGLTGESGEVADIIKKGVFHGHELNKEELKKELGDVLWYISSLAAIIDVPLEQIACMNIDKLRKRYPKGFNQYDSINRVEEE